MHKAAECLHSQFWKDPFLLLSFPFVSSAVSLHMCSCSHRFLLKDTDTDRWYDVGVEYAKEKVSHALRSRPNSERRKRMKAKRAAKKSTCPPELETKVNHLIADQQQLLESLIQREVLPISPVEGS